MCRTSPSLRLHKRLCACGFRENLRFTENYKEVLGLKDLGLRGLGVKGFRVRCLGGFRMQGFGMTTTKLFWVQGSRCPGPVTHVIT